MTTLHWTFKPRSDLIVNCLPRKPTDTHPLKRETFTNNTSTKTSRRGSVSNGVKTKTFEPVIFDPLGCVAVNLPDTTDAANIDDSMYFQEPILDKPKPTITAWESKCAEILSKYTTSNRLDILIGKKGISAATSIKMKTRLEQLDELNDIVKHEHDLTQHEYTQRIEQLGKEVVTAWHNEDRVRALKIVIQCAKLLADTNVIDFYPSKFVLITSILDKFGELVYQRLFDKAQANELGERVNVPTNFTPEMIGKATKETCRNWFYKIASIRELIPRLFIEMAIMNSYKYLTSSAFSDALMRLTRMIRGIGHPLVALYARCYLCRIGVSVSRTNTDKQYLLENYQEFLRCYEQIFTKSIYIELSQQSVKFDTYMELYTPALEYILDRAISESPIDQKQFLIELLARFKPIKNNLLLLNAIICTFKASCVSELVTEVVDLIDDNVASVDTRERYDIAPHVVIRNLGVCLMQAPPTHAQQREVFDKIWRIVMSFNDPLEYVLCAEIWAKYIIMNFSNVEINIFLGDVLKHLTNSACATNYSHQLHSLLDNILSKTNDLAGLLIMSNFLPIIDLFCTDDERVDACRKILTHTRTIATVSDPLVINALMFLCKILHRVVNTLTVDDEKRQIAAIINQCIRSVDFGTDVEAQLNFYVEARSSFLNLEAILIQLVQHVNRLSVFAHSLDKSIYHSPRKIGSFMRACAAYCFITIPSIESVFTCLDLYLLSGRVALFNNCLGQAEACLNSALSMLSRAPEFVDVDGKRVSSEKVIAGYLKNFISTLLIIPDVPNEEILYVLKYFIQTLHEYIKEQPKLLYFSAFVSILDILALASREKYPYRADKVESNDTLYGCDQVFINEINSIADVLVVELLKMLKNLTDQDTRAILLLELFNVVIMRCDLQVDSTQSLAIKLWTLILDSSPQDMQLLKRTISYYKSIAKSGKNDGLIQILKTIATL